MSLTMSKAEREAFLAETHVAIISIGRDGIGPLTLPIWYRYEPGGAVHFITGATSEKLRLIRATGRMSLCVQSELPPYKYVSIEGPTRIVDEPDFERDVKQMAYRYLGEQLGDWYLASTADERERVGNVLIELTPERWLTVDYAKMV